MKVVNHRIRRLSEEGVGLCWHTIICNCTKIRDTDDVPGICSGKIVAVGVLYTYTYAYIHIHIYKHKTYTYTHNIRYTYTDSRHITYT